MYRRKDLKPFVIGFVLWTILNTGDALSRSLCPVGWERCINKCHKIFQVNVNTYDEATALCESQGVNVTLALLEKQIIKDCFVNFIKTSGLTRALIVLHDISYETIFEWDDQNDLYIEDWPEPEKSRMEESLIQPNDETKNCVEVGADGEWILTECINPSGWKSIVCQVHIPTGTICGLEGDSITL